MDSVWGILQGGQAGSSITDPRPLVLLAVLLMLAIGIPSLPPVFHRLVQKLALPFRQAETDAMPTPGFASMLQGLALTPGCWFMIGASFWATLQAAGIGAAWGWESWWRYTAFMALAYVSGFVIIFLPSGLGVREALLVLLLVPDISQRLHLQTEDARSLAALAVILLRVVWTAAELVMVSALYWLPVSMPRGQSTPAEGEQPYPERVVTRL